MGTHNSEDSFIRNFGNLFMGLYGNIVFLLFHSNGMHLLIITWTGYGILVGYWFSHLDHIPVGLYNLALQLWVFHVNFSGNNVIY